MEESIFGSRIFIMFLIVFTTWFKINAQEWQTMGNIENIVDNYRILELYPDTSEDKLFIGGHFQSIGNTLTSNITSFDGHQYDYISLEINECSNLGCRGVSSIIRYKDNIIASSIRSANYENDPQIIGIGRWDGGAWYPMDGGIATDYDEFYEYYDPGLIFDFCISNDILYVAGYFKYVDSLPEAGLAAWDGTQWTIFNVPAPPLGDAILATSVSKYKGDIYLGGNFDVTLEGDTINDLIKYDGNTWQKVGDGLIDGWTNMHDLEVFQDKLIVSGYFTKTDGNPGNSIMSWDGEHWNDMAGGICTPYGAIDDLFVYGDKLYVAGYFDCIGGIEAHNVAVWDGAKWCSIGNSTFDKAVHAIAVWHDTVYIGGSFLKINDQPSRLFARYVGNHSTDVCSDPVNLTEEPSRNAARLLIIPNPVKDQLTISVSMGNLLPTVWRVFNTSGQEMTVLINPISLSTAQQQVLEVQNLPTGVYFLQGLGQEGIATGKFVKM